ncbi:MAG: type IV pilus inner membrane component PilO [Armatimonadota bacterium]
MLAIRPSKKVFIGLICVAILIIGIDGYLYYNRSSRLAILQQELDQKSKKLQDSKQIAQRLSQVEGRYFDVQSQMSTLEQGVSSRAYVPSLLKQLESLGRNNKLMVVGVRPTPVAVAPPTVDSDGQPVKKEPEPYDKTNIDIDVTGNYWNIVTFIEQLTSFPKIIAVREVQISPLANNTSKTVGSRKLNAKFNTTAFILRPAPANTEKTPSFRIINKIEERKNENQ